ncbi:MAG: OmpA family protein [Dysgonamonadaceae bacterium]|jgi:outer membrane protein OmpA-like peptidoglycan-associated protein|nr:OmpA family protein [Dysgonamonadaceae bacterium]
MKKILLLVCVLGSVLSVKAQDGLAVEQQYPGDAKAAEIYRIAAEKQNNPKTSALRTTWIANKPSSNWFISGRLGGGGVWSKHATDAGFWSPWDWANDKETFWHPQWALSLGKWFTPVWGARLDVSPRGSSYVFKNQYPNEDKWQGTSGTKYWTATIDYLVNLKNFFLPYNPKAFFNPVLYGGVGAIHTNKGSNDDGFYNIAAKGGLQLNFRLNDAFDLFLDGQALLVPGRFDRDPSATFISSDVITNASIGLTYRFNFRHFIKSPICDQDLIDALNKEINDLRNRPVPVCPPVKVCPEPEVKETVTPTTVSQVELTPVFFKINSSAVLSEQLVSVARAAQYLLDNPSAKIEIKAYSDKKTGTAKVNLKLSEARANSVAKVLTQKFGIDKSRIKTSFYGDTVQPFNENDKNRVAIFVK